MSHTLSHPAVAVATSAVAGCGGDTVPAGIIVRDNLAAVVVDSTEARFIVMMEGDGDTWTAQKYISGTARPNRERDAHTTDRNPLRSLARKPYGLRTASGERPEFGWLAVTGLAAEDAVSVSVTSELETQTTPVESDGLAFAVVRVRPDEKPSITVNTRDGRSVLVALP